MNTVTMSTAILDMPTLTTNRTPKVPASYDRIVLTGFMGSGKTTVGGLLAERVGWTFVDLDLEIARREGRSVPHIFAESGEAAFRQAETAALASVLGRRRVVLALGGGAPEELGNRLLLEQTPKTAVVYLAAEFATLVARCLRQAEEPEATTRPVLADERLAEARFAKRKPHYERIAGFVVEAEVGAEECVESVMGALGCAL